MALTPTWLENIVALSSGEYRHLKLFRPSSVDLILTKMMRGDREDMEDIRFILSQEKIAPSVLDDAFLKAKPLEIPELQSIFIKMQPVVREMALEIEKSRSAKHRSGTSGISLDPDWWEKLTEQPPRNPEIERDRGIEL